jgi:anti-sigma regulatory factor (Ser/Thr protein kinase)
MDQLNLTSVRGKYPATGHPLPWLAMVAHLRVDADVARLVEIRRFIRSQAAAAEAPVECLDDLVQAIDEAATNVIQHGYRGSPGWLEVGTALEDGRFIVTLEDAAPTFDPTTVPEPDLELQPMARKPGGMGVHLIRQSTDGLSYRPRPGGGNILTMVRSLERGPKEEG